MFVTDLWFNAFAVEFSATGIVELASFSMASSDSGITFFIYMKGVTTSAMMFTVGVHSVESFMKKVGPAFMRLLQLTANVSINTMSLIRGIKPGKLNPLRELNSLPYGYLLKVILKDLKLSPNILNITIFQIVVQSKFCIFKCHRTPNTGYQLEQCETLDRNDFRDTKKISKILYMKCCNDGSTLDWMKKVKLSHFKNNQELRILLPGIYEIVNLSFPNNPESDTFNYSLRISWQNKNILKTINGSLQLKKKQFFIFSPGRNKTNIFSWLEAEEFCVQRGGHLPSFSSQSDVQDLINIILRAAWTGPIRMIYIGLNVGSFSCLLYCLLSKIS